MEKSLDSKLAHIREGKYTPADFIIADAKDGDMGGGITAFGALPGADGYVKSFPDHLAAISEISRSELVDIMLMSASAAERVVAEDLFSQSPVTPAVRLNDTTDIWGARHSSYKKSAARNFRSARLERVAPLVSLGLYSITFSNDLQRDLDSLQQFQNFLSDIAGTGMRYFLEVFNPQIDIGIRQKDLPEYVNDSIVRCLAGLTAADMPQFLKIPYNGPKAMEELCQYDPGHLVVGVLGGGAGTTRDTFELIRQSEKYGARVALFGRKILFSEDSKYIVKMMRSVVQGELDSAEAVKAYHAHLAEQGIRAFRNLTEDSKVTEAVLRRNM